MMELFPAIYCVKRRKTEHISAEKAKKHSVNVSQEITAPVEDAALLGHDATSVGDWIPVF